jgi:hypothetical protein
MHGTSAAQCGAATKLGARETQLIADDPQQWRICFGIGLGGLTVDLKIDTHQRLLKISTVEYQGKVITMRESFFRVYPSTVTYDTQAP